MPSESRAAAPYYIYPAGITVVRHPYSASAWSMLCTETIAVIDHSRAGISNFRNFAALLACWLLGVEDYEGALGYVFANSPSSTVHFAIEEGMAMEGGSMVSASRRKMEVGARQSMLLIERKVRAMRENQGECSVGKTPTKLAFRRVSMLALSQSKVESCRSAPHYPQSCQDYDAVDGREGVGDGGRGVPATDGAAADGVQR